MLLFAQFLRFITGGGFQMGLLGRGELRAAVFLGEPEAVLLGGGDAAVQVGEGLGVHGVVLAACQRQHGGPGQQQRHVPRALAARGKGFLGAVSKIGHGLTLR